MTRHSYLTNPGSVITGSQEEKKRNWSDSKSLQCSVFPAFADTLSRSNVFFSFFSLLLLGTVNNAAWVGDENVVSSFHRLTPRFTSALDLSIVAQHSFLDQLVLTRKRGDRTLLAIKRSQAPLKGGEGGQTKSRVILFLRDLDWVTPHTREGVGIAYRIS